MKIVFVTRWFSQGMGYIENCLPYAMAKLGHEVHIITSTAQVYYNEQFYAKTYQIYLGNPVVDKGTSINKGVYLHRLGFRQYKKQILIKGLSIKINEIEPDVVQVFEHVAIDTFRIAINNVFKRYKLFTANHVVLSVYPLAKKWKNLSLFQKIRWRLFTWLPGKLISILVDKSYAVTQDAGYIAEKFMGVAHSKVEISTLGVDTELFYPFDDNEKKNILKENLGFSRSDIICIYTGRFTDEKNPLLAAKVIQELNDEGYKFKGLFIGEGEQKEEIAKLPASRVIDFVHYTQLPQYYKIADIGVWPGQESTSQLDTVASGANLVLPDAIKAYALADNKDTSEIRPKIVSRFYKHFNEKDLKEKLLSLKSQEERIELQQNGVREIVKKYSWNVIAMRRLEDYQRN